MIGSGLTILLLAGGVVVAEPPRRPAPQIRALMSQIQIRERVIVRVPTRTERPRQTTRWRERGAPRCMPLQGLAGAAVTERDSVDLLFVGGRRIRAELESECAGLDFYSGFYLRPTEDRRICAGRDSIHARSGGQCEIRRFRTLVPDD